MYIHKVDRHREGDDAEGTEGLCPLLLLGHKHNSQRDEHHQCRDDDPHLEGAGHMC